MDTAVDELIHVEERDRMNQSLKSAVLINNAVQVEFLLSKGADVNGEDFRGCRGWPPLHHAAYQGHEACLAILIKSGAKVDATDATQATAAAWAAMNGHRTCLGLLINAGADVNIACNDGPLAGQTPAINAAYHGYENCLSMLIGAGADIELADKEGFTPTMWAARRGHQESLGSLIAAGADLERSCHKGRTATMLAASNGQLGCLRALMDMNIDLRKVDHQGKSAGDHANQSGFVTCADAIHARELARDECAALASATSGAASASTTRVRPRSL